MEWREKFDRLLRTPATLQTEGYVGERGPTASSNEVYLTVDVSAIWITHVRKGISKFYGAVHGSIEIPHEMGEKREFQAFNAIANARELDAVHLDRIIQGPYRLLNAVPYRGAGINVRVALLSIESADLAAPYIQLLKSVSDIAGVSFLSQASLLAAAIHTGVATLTSSDSIEIGRYGLFDPVYTGHYAVVRANPTELPLDQLAFDENSRILTFRGTPVEDYPYLVLNIVASPEREYWYDIPDIKDAYKRIKDQFRATPNDLEANLRAFDAFQVATELSPDLLEDHARKLVEDARRRFERYISQARMGGEEGEDPLELPLQSLQPFS